MIRVALFLLLAANLCAQINTNELVRLAYGAALTASEKVAKNKASAELNELGLEKLRALFANLHTPNMYIRFDIDSLVHRNRDKVGPVLLDFLDSEDPKTRKYAAYYLGFTPLAKEAHQLAPLLDNPVTSGAAIRTLGKWHATNQLERIQTFLESEKEKTRITAVNALRDVNDPRAIPALIPLLDDAQMTVRYVAERALTVLAKDQAQVLVDALDLASPVAKRHLIHCVGDLKATTALPTLESLAKSEDPGLRADAEEAIANILAPIEP